MLNLTHKFGNDMSFEDTNKFGITRIVDVCTKSNGKVAMSIYNKRMNSDGEFNSMPIYLDEIKEIIELLESEHEK